MREELASLRGGSCGEYRASPVPTGFIGHRLHLGGVSTCRGLVGALEMRLDELDERREQLIKVRNLSTVGVPLAVRFRSGFSKRDLGHQAVPKRPQRVTTKGPMGTVVKGPKGGRLFKNSLLGRSWFMPT